MSLVNDVLRDLDARERGAPDDRPDARPEFGGRRVDTRAAPTTRPRRIGWRYAMGCVVLAGIAFGGSAPLRPEPVLRPALAPDVAVGPSSGARPSLGSEPASGSATDPGEPVRPADANRIGVSQPPAPTSPRASSLEIPGSRRTPSVDTLRHAPAAASPHRARANSALLPRYVRPLRQDTASPRAPSGRDAQPRSDAPAGPPATSAETDPGPPAAAIAAPAAPPASPTAAPEPAAASYVEVIPRMPSDEERLLNDFHAAAAAYREGAFADAERRLKELLGRDDERHRARLLLARLYADRGLDERAEAVLSQGLLRFPRHAPYVDLYARILARQGRDGAAIALLRNALPAAHEHAELHALLAALHQRSGDPAAAAKGYVTALRIDPTPGEWWMGLGISSEQVDDADTAEKAYRSALQRPLADDVERYVELRLRELIDARTTGDGTRSEADLES